jgi:hypothetical protein
MPVPRALPKQASSLVMTEKLPNIHLSGACAVEMPAGYRLSNLRA